MDGSAELNVAWRDNIQYFWVGVISWSTGRERVWFLSGGDRNGWNEKEAM